ncbi:sigma-70 family RNA polymerase sigma factor [Synechococcus sp. CB0101]|uniref:sigma-70 family RNA polymerase sigma factor n=1 Tax=Synechococcus sp. CB0101 TaxID=232348 RepID=UPI00020012E0|nr:sigma-70 family RNA polymerase sigma factor [Synechococcus sp. CB0101]QCH15576.1 sigma-70 family RNA polymerase sigma factor [Synechococcus sp. CB0101]
MPARHAPVASTVKTWLNTSSAHRPLCERTVMELSRRIQRWQQHPDGPSHAPKPVRRSALRAREQLVRHNLGLVAHTWGRHRCSLPAHDDTTADALQEAALNLVRAAEKFDPAKGYRFSTYATFWVRRGFTEFEQRAKRAIRFPAEKAAVVLKALRLSQQHQATTGDEPALEWLAAQLKFDGKAMSAEQLAEFIRQWDATRTGSLDGAEEEGDEKGGCSRLDLASLQQAAEQQLTQEPDPQHASLPQLMSCLDEQEHRLIRNRYLRRPPLSPCQLRRSMGGMQREQLEQLEATALDKLRQAATGHNLKIQL